MMRILMAILGLLLIAAPGIAGTPQSITDSAGRTVDLPARIDTVVAAGPPAAILLYVMAPERMLGWPQANRANERDFLARPYADLPELGTLTGQGGEANLERVLALAPDLIIDFGSVRDTYVDLADRVQEQTGIPYLLIDGRFENTPAALRLLGEALGIPERGEALARDTEASFARIDELNERIADAERPRAYLARGPDGLESGVVGSINTEILEWAGGINVLGRSDAARGLVRVNFEALLAADPDIIVTWDRQFYETHRDDPLWARMRAVREGRVHLSPILPFGWIDRPPSINRLIGLDWIAATFFPDTYAIDLRARTREFYQLWYHLDLSDDQLDTLLP
ncbi:iron ABC transporter substrate-binding protein [Saliniramus fredricksonii]|uniref:Iron complex transport system substrate-binding protein n=1 Tax=Saliniramus fredricksonii TaxID=1653334 RepID=A0ABY0KD28_9HYPH|nr:iron ABC transporter substrate-binding protein [Saliniramus fredricksonii]SCC82350.1 iron complex transport system substrate-binding protein [Saliniramus fredricksonii]